MNTGSAPRPLDLLFVARDTDSDELVVLEHQEETMGSALEPGGAAGLMLSPETVAAMEPQLAAMSDAVRASES